MLELKNIKKTYHVGEIETKALDGINVAFREKEFVAILGASGSGKTTCLNIIGGLDHYDEGDLVIKGKSTKSFKNHEWDSYRNNSIGFVFQSYNLINHLSIVANVEMSMTLSGVSKDEKHKKALEVLEKVGLKQHLHKRPNQLSGGQMQRVAIARALANDPEILLCDEPTGALDSNTSIQIMDLIKEVAKDRLVIMVTHNPTLAEEYADRIIKFEDGRILDDTHPHQERPKPDSFKLKKTSMNFFTAIKLSFNNLRTKKGRTFLTAFASSIGIIGIAVILSLSTGFQSEIDDYQRDAMAEFPVFAVKTTQKIDEDSMQEMSEEMHNRMGGKSEYKDTDKLIIKDSKKSVITHNNSFSKEFMDYINKADKDVCSSIGYMRLVNLNLVRKDKDGKYVSAKFSTVASQDNAQDASAMTSMSSMGISAYPKNRDEGKDYLKDNYELISGEYPKSETDIVLVVSTKNEIDKQKLNELGFNIDKEEEIDFDKVVGTKFKWVPNNEYYAKAPNNMFMPQTDYEKMYKSDKGKELKISAIVRAKKGSKMTFLGSGVAYSDDLIKSINDDCLKSDIVKAQKKTDKNVLTMQKMDKETKKMFLETLGGSDQPYMVMMFPTSFESKDKLIEYIDKYNEGKDKDDQITYTDLAGSISDMTSGIMDGVTLVLIAFAAISLIVSMIMIGIITYTSVLERTKEIGILKALGARKKDITRVFDAETMILGVFSGVFGVVVAWACTFPMNNVIKEKSGLEHASHLQLKHAIILVIISAIITMIGGHIPARIASKKDAVEALRSE